MADLTVLIGTVGALAGVGLGSWSTARYQRALFRDTHRLANVTARESAYQDFLTTARQFRRFMMTQPMTVRLIERPGGRPSTPVIDDPGTHWEDLDAAQAKLAILAGDREINSVASEVTDAIYSLIRARASYTQGEIPDEIIALGRDAEKKFARTAREDLTYSRSLERAGKRSLGRKRGEVGPDA
jgi:hypothetical protein